MIAMSPATYSRTQIILHWTVVLLVLFQIVFSSDIVQAWTARIDSTLPNVPTPHPHAIAGMAIFALMAWRLVLRFRRGVPALPANDPPLIKLAANVTHVLLYVLLLGMPLSGGVAWFLGVEAAAFAHSTARLVLVPLIALHFAAALAQHFWFKTDVLKRMLGMA
jgi:cytochrome b561